MKNVPRLEVAESLDCLIENVGESTWIFVDVFVQVGTVHVFHKYVPGQLLRIQMVVEYPYDVLVVHVMQQLDLS